MMKVKELLRALADVDIEAEIILQKDAAGNSYSPLAGVDIEVVYIPKTSWSGEAFSLNWSADEAEKTEKEWQNIIKRTRCVVLHPIN